MNEAGELRKAVTEQCLQANIILFKMTTFLKLQEVVIQHMEGLGTSISLDIAI